MINKRVYEGTGKRVAEEIEYADITRLGYPDESFDKVVAGNVIHLLELLFPEG